MPRRSGLFDLSGQFMEMDRQLKPQGVVRLLPFGPEQAADALDPLEERVGVDVQGPYPEPAQQAAAAAGQGDTGAERFRAARDGGGAHRYVFVVHALDVESIGIPADSTPAFLGFTMARHILGRAVLTATAETPA